jgi:hypothetical protein
VMQVGLTVSGHERPDHPDLALGVAVRQWESDSRSRVWCLGVFSRSGRLARVSAEMGCLACGASCGALENRSHANVRQR